MAKLPNDITLYSFTVRSVWFYALVILIAINTALRIYQCIR